MKDSNAIFKPILGVSANIPKIKYPVLATPKLDGIRSILRNGQCTSRNMKPIPNRYVRTLIEELAYDGVMFDGEIICNNNFNETSSSVMCRDGEPAFTYMIFDIITSYNYTEPYESRMKKLFDFSIRVESNPSLSKYVTCLLPVKINNEKELYEYEEICLKMGYEGLCIRIPESPYKFGRSTVNEGYLLKIKRFEDSEAEIIGFEELQSNQNEATKDVFGHTDRTSHKAGMVPQNTMGALRVRDIETGVEFSVGSGFTSDDRESIWKRQSFYLGKLIKYKHQPCGKKDAPRFPVFLGFRDPNDL